MDFTPKRELGGKTTDLLVIYSHAECWLHSSASFPSPHLRTVLSPTGEARLRSLWILIRCCANECAQHRSENICQRLFIEPAGGQANPRQHQVPAPTASLFRSLVSQKWPQTIVSCEDQRQEVQLAHRRDRIIFFGSFGKRKLLWIEADVIRASLRMYRALGRIPCGAPHPVALTSQY